MAGLAFNKLFGGDRWTAIGYRSPESGQNEITITHTQIQNGVYDPVYTVEKGKTLYITDIIMSDEAAVNNGAIGTGATPVDMLWIFLGAGGLEHVPFHIVPLKFESETLISFKCDGAGTAVKLILIGWLE